MNDYNYNYKINKVKMENFLNGLKQGYNNLWTPLAIALYGLQSSLVKNLTHPD